MAVQLGAAQPLSGADLSRKEGAIMAVEVETRTGRCATHGTVEASREIPKMGFPFFYYAIRRAQARKRPFLCPDCGEPVNS